MKLTCGAATCSRQSLVVLIKRFFRKTVPASAENGEVFRIVEDVFMQNPQILDRGFHHTQNHFSVIVISPRGVKRPGKPHPVIEKILKASQQMMFTNGLFPVLGITLQ